MLEICGRFSSDDFSAQTLAICKGQVLPEAHTVTLLRSNLVQSRFPAVRLFSPRFASVTSLMHNTRNLYLCDSWQVDERQGENSR